MLRPHQPCHVLVDFDGTIASIDTTDAILERFALPEWRTIEAAWNAGEIGSRECLTSQVALLRATPAELDAFTATVKIDDKFAEFYAYAESCGLSVTIVSDGLDRIVAATLARAGLAVEVRANHLEHIGNGRWQVSFPHGDRDCTAQSGNCKCRTPDPDPDPFARRIVVGDGRSDFCVAEHADLVLATSHLAAHARLRNLPHATFTNFAEAKVKLAQWLDAPRGQRTPTADSLKQRATQENMIAV